VTDAPSIPRHERPKPRLRGRLHQVAFFASIPAGLVLLLFAPSGADRVASVVYWITLLAQFGTSAVYHRGTWQERSYNRMRRADHATIFLLIAGTYTGLCMLALSGTTRLVVLLVVWIGAAIGIATKFYRVDLHVLSGFMYLGLGWVAVVVLPAIFRGLLVLVGGVVYSLGALVLARNKPDPFPATYGYHEVWHTATIAAAACFYTAILVAYLAA
jgi:hemolysin III